MAKNKPSNVAVKRHTVNSTVSPFVVNRLITAVKTIINISALRPLTINLKGTFEIFITAARQRITNAYPIKLLITNSDII